MTKTIMPALFTMLILLTGTIVASVELIQPADAIKSRGENTPSRGAALKSYGSANNHIVCGDRLCSEVGEDEQPKYGKKKQDTEKVKIEEAKKASEKYQQTTKEQKTTTTTKYKSSTMTNEELKAKKKMAEEEKAKTTLKKEVRTKTIQEAKALSSAMTSNIVSRTITSAQDPGMGHESHQLAIILPPSDNIYRGHLTYSASEPIQLVALHGPLGAGEDKGQPIWTPDGKTKFALTLVNTMDTMGMWAFTGNAIAVHTMNSNPFTVTYAVSYTERILDDAIQIDTITSAQDPGVGHENHQLAIILPPRETAYNGYITYSASEDVQIVTLVGPLKKSEMKGQATWSPDGQTHFGLMIIHPNKSSGSWEFSGNAIAFHTMKPEQFTVSYSLVMNN